MVRYLLVLLLSIGTAHASFIDSTWNAITSSWGANARYTHWSGNCSAGCVGQATMDLVVRTPFVLGPSAGGGFFEVDMLVRYHDSQVPDALFTPDNIFATGDVPIGIANFGWFFNDLFDFHFIEHADGTWDSRIELTATGPLALASGTLGVFTPFAIPEPATLALLLLSLLLGTNVAALHRRQGTSGHNRCVETARPLG